MRWRTAILIGLVLAVVTGVGAGLWAGRTPQQEPFDWPPSDRVQAAVQSLRTDPFYVAPEMRHLLTTDQRSAISSALDRPEGLPLRLLFMHGTTDGGYYLDSDLLDRLAEQLGDGLYAVVDERMEVTQRDYGVRVSYISDPGVKARPGDGLLSLAGEMANAPTRESTESDYWGGPGGGFAAGLLIAAGLSIPIALLWAIVRAVAASRRQEEGAR